MSEIVATGMVYAGRGHRRWHNITHPRSTRDTEEIVWWRHMKSNKTRSKFEIHGEDAKTARPEVGRPRGHVRYL